MELQYVCRGCVEAAGIGFNAVADNSAGRKQCCVCGGCGDSRLHVITEDSEMVALASGLMVALVRERAELKRARTLPIDSARAREVPAPAPALRSAGEARAQLDRIEAMSRAMLSRFYGHAAVAEAFGLVGQEFGMLPGETAVGDMEGAGR